MNEEKLATALNEVIDHVTGKSPLKSTILPPRIVLSPPQQLATMIRIVGIAHEFQFDAQGDPYSLHCQTVQHYVRKFAPDDYELQAIAAGHDLIEDTKTTYQYLIEEGMSDRVITAIGALTNQPGETEEQKMARILANVDAMIVKAIGDLRHNTDIRRGKGLSPKDFARLEKYHTRYSVIKTELREKHGIHIS